MRRLLALIVLSSTFAGCQSDLRFERDDRLRFVRPPNRAEVTLPLILEWRMRGLPAGGFYAVFLDRAPMRSGHDLDSLAEDVDPACVRARGCPDRRWLEEHGVLVSARPRVAVRALDPRQGRPASRQRRRHDLTVVVLDRRGVRIDESAWRRTVFVAGPR